MARRTEIVNYLADKLRLISTESGYNTTVSQVHRSYKYLDDINDFPTLCLGVTPREQFDQSQTQSPLKSLTMTIRGYVHTAVEDSLQDSERLARDVEQVVSTFADASSNLEVHRSQVVTLVTDEGLFSPYGICDVGVEIYYAD